MKIDILGVKIDRISLTDTLQKIKDYLNSDKLHLIVTPNPEFLVAAYYDQEFKNILNSADLAIPDGFGLKLAGLYLKKPLLDRITGTDLVYEIAKICSQEKKSIYFLGALPSIAEKAAINLKNQFPPLKIAGFESGFRTRFYFKLPDFLLLTKINRSKPDVLLVAYGAVKQEKWIAKHLKNMPSVKIAIGIGGAFDFISGEVKRSPRIIRQLGLEWFWRLIKQPWRFNRILTATFRFSHLVIKTKNHEKD